MTISKHRKFWAVRDPDGALVCLTVYRRGAREVVRRLEGTAPDASEKVPPAQTPGGGNG